jgi:hypothetical protein
MIFNDSLYRLFCIIGLNLQFLDFPNISIDISISVGIDVHYNLCNRSIVWILQRKVLKYKEH